MRVTTLGITVLAVLLSSSGLGCADPTADDAVDQTSELGVEGPAIDVDATWAHTITGTPTIGFDATTPSIHVSARVDDEVVRRDHPGFDGLERPYAIVPRADGSTTRLPLDFTGTDQVGFIQLRPIDTYANDWVMISEDDLRVVRSHGVTVALDTNVGVVGGDTYPVK